jgi:hypothetical protein
MPIRNERHAVFCRRRSFTRAWRLVLAILLAGPVGVRGEAATGIGDKVFVHSRNGYMTAIR